MDSIIPQPQEPQYQPPMSEPKHFLNKKFTVIFVVLILLGSSVYTSIWYWQNQQVAQEVAPTFTPRADDETTDWKTYTNTQYGFEFKYPVEFSRSVEIGKDKLEREDHIFFISLGNISDDQITISIFDREFNPNNILTTYGHFEANESQKINIGNRIAYKYEEGDGGVSSFGNPNFT